MTMLLKSDNKFSHSDPIRRAEEAVDEWLDREHLNMNRKKKQRVAALVAHLFHDDPNISKNKIINYIGNLGGGADVDMDNPDMVEIEVQRLLGQSEPASKSSNVSFVRVGIILLIINFLFIALNINMFVSNNNHSNLAPAPSVEQQITPEQIQEIYSLAEDVATVETEVSGAAFESEDVWVAITDIHNIKNIEEISQDDFLRVRRHLRHWYRVNDVMKVRKLEGKTN